jgi:hypothetical protein
VVFARRVLGWLASPAAGVRWPVSRCLAAAAKAAQQAAGSAVPGVDDVVTPDASTEAEAAGAGRWARFLAWFDTDPVGSLLARRRVRRADRTARRAVAALPARADVQDSAGPGGSTGAGEQDGGRS